MRKGTFQYIEQILVDYNQTEKHIQQRINELKYPVQIVDENIGGGNSLSSFVSSSNSAIRSFNAFSSSCKFMVSPPINLGFRKCSRRFHRSYYKVDMFHRYVHQQYKNLFDV